jgi:hypothetical protein
VGLQRQRCTSCNTQLGAANCAEYLKQHQDNPKVVDELVLLWMWGIMSGFQFLAQKPQDLSQVNSEAAKICKFVPKKP